MDKEQKQQVMVKLAQVRLAINHVMRKRAMAKQAMTGDGYPDYTGWGALGAVFNRPRTAWRTWWQKRQVENLPTNRDPAVRYGTSRGETYPPNNVIQPGDPYFNTPKLDKNNFSPKTIK